MECIKLHIDTEPTLSVAYQKKGQKVSKIRGSYYPFSLQHTNYNSDLLKLKREEQSNEKTLSQDTHPTTPFANPGYNYKFNGMELQGTVFYDFGARNYDPGRALKKCSEDIFSEGASLPRGEMMTRPHHTTTPLTTPSIL